MQKKNNNITVHVDMVREVNESEVITIIDHLYKEMFCSALLAICR